MTSKWKPTAVATDQYSQDSTVGNHVANTLTVLNFDLDLYASPCLSIPGELVRDPYTQSQLTQKTKQKKTDTTDRITFPADVVSNRQQQTASTPVKDKICNVMGA